MAFQTIKSILFQVVKFLLNAGVDKAARDIAGDTPMHYAVLGGQPATLSLLITRGAQTGLRDSKLGRTPLHDAVAKDLTECTAILLARANAEVRDDENMATPLHIAAWFNRAEIAQQLLARRVSPTLTDRNQLAPIHWAAIQGSCDVMKILLTESNVLMTGLKGGNYGRTPLHACFFYPFLFCFH